MANKIASGFLAIGFALTVLDLSIGLVALVVMSLNIVPFEPPPIAVLLLIPAAALFIVIGLIIGFFADEISS
jgi:hypothetical protein